MAISKHISRSACRCSTYDEKINYAADEDENRINKVNKRAGQITQGGSTKKNAFTDAADGTERTFYGPEFEEETFAFERDPNISDFSS